MHRSRQIAEKIINADAILIGASNGLSITEGLHLFAEDQAFEELFGDFKCKYGIRSILHGMSVRWPSEEEKWASLVLPAMMMDEAAPESPFFFFRRPADAHPV